MIFGSLIGGMTTEGGGAIAFPVMTLAMNISPIVARDFSFMIQSCGIFTGIAGSGIDVYSFSILTLLFRISEKIATPTSVILMAANSIESWEYFAVCLPIVVIFAPIGSFIASYLHRLTLASFIYILETIALVSALIIIKPNWSLRILTLTLIIGSLIFYMIMARYGQKLTIQTIKPTEVKEKMDNATIASVL
ncbi:hypothetical protein DINM_003757 [Dirofilaria immitis]|nr:hypothetical protein [Dirofilaria immitis]